MFHGRRESAGRLGGRRATPGRWPAIIVMAVALMLPIPGWAAGATVNTTRVITYRPGAGNGRARSGYCWTESIAVQRPGAWRCMAGNEIHDPCFTSPRLADAVICGANPAIGKPGFALRLTRPLPQPSPIGATRPSPWLLKLADGAVCQAFTGTLPFVNKLIVRYGCSDSKGCSNGDCPHLTGVLGNLVPGKLWIARKITYRVGRDGPALIKLEAVPIAEAWR